MKFIHHFKVMNSIMCFSHEMKPKNQSSKAYFFQFVYMTLAIDIMYECGPSSEVHRELLVKK